MGWLVSLLTYDVMEFFTQAFILFHSSCAGWIEAANAMETRCPSMLWLS